MTITTDIGGLSQEKDFSRVIKKFKFKKKTEILDLELELDLIFLCLKV